MSGRDLVEAEVVKQHGREQKSMEVEGKRTGRKGEPKVIFCLKYKGTERRTMK